MNRIPISGASPAWSSCESCLPTDLPEHLKTRVRQLASFRIQLERGETLIHAGASFHGLYAVCRGAFKSVFLGEDGTQQITGFHRPHQLLGLSGIADKVYVADVVTLQAAEVFEFSWRALESLAEVSPEFLEHLLDYVSERLAQAKRDQFMLGSMSSSQKIAYFLLQIRAIEGDPDAMSFNLPMTREDIGSYLGLTMETVSRLLSQLSKAGVVSIDRKRIAIQKAGVLEAWMDGDTKPFSWKSPVVA